MAGFRMWRRRLDGAGYRSTRTLGLILQSAIFPDILGAHDNRHQCHVDDERSGIEDNSEAECLLERVSGLASRQEGKTSSRLSDQLASPSGLA